MGSETLSETNLKGTVAIKHSNIQQMKHTAIIDTITNLREISSNFSIFIKHGILSDVARLKDHKCLL